MIGAGPPAAIGCGRLMYGGTPPRPPSSFDTMDPRDGYSSFTGILVLAPSAKLGLYPVNR